MLPVEVEEESSQTPLQCNEADQCGSDDSGAHCLNRSEAPSLPAATVTLSPLSEHEESAWQRLTSTEHGG